MDAYAAKGWHEEQHDWMKYTENDCTQIHICNMFHNRGKPAKKGNACAVQCAPMND